MNLLIGSIQKTLKYDDYNLIIYILFIPFTNNAPNKEEYGIMLPFQGYGGPRNPYGLMVNENPGWVTYSHIHVPLGA